MRLVLVVPVYVLAVCLCCMLFRTPCTHFYATLFDSPLHLPDETLIGFFLAHIFYILKNRYYMVGVPGLEPGTSRSQSAHSSQLSYTPIY